MTDLEVILAVFGIFVGSFIVAIPLSYLVIEWLHRDALRFWGLEPKTGPEAQNYRTLKWWEKPL